MSQPEGSTATITGSAIGSTASFASTATIAAPWPSDEPGAAEVGRSRARAIGRLLGSELLLIFGRRRNWAALLALAAVPVMIAVSVKFWAAPGGGGGGLNDGLVGQITHNGIFVALFALNLELPLFLPLAVAMISSDAIAGEANSGTLRYLLTVPVHRTRLLAVKYSAVVVFAIVATLVVAVTGLVFGLALFGGGTVTLLSGSQVSFGVGLWRLLLVCGYLAVAMAALGAIGLFVSTLTEQPIGATVAVLVVCIGSQITTSISQLHAVHPFLPTYYWSYFGDLLRDPIATQQIDRGLLVSAVYVVVFTAASWARFAGRDVTS